MTNPWFIFDVLQLTSELDIREQLLWTTEPTSRDVRFSLDCSDVFAWGTADGEQITPDNIQRLRDTYQQCKNLGIEMPEDMAVLVFCASERKMRPQGAAYPMDRKVWPLLDACGPVRNLGLDNPFQPGRRTKGD